MLDQNNESNNNDLTISIHIARQPILTPSYKIFGYDLLYRSDETNAANFDNEGVASTKVCLNAFTDIGLKNLIGETIGFIKLDKAHIDTAILIPPDGVILDIHSDDYEDKDLLDNIKFLIRKRYSVAISIKQLTELNADILHCIKFLKIDVRGKTPQELESFCELVKSYNIQLIATMIESHEAFEMSKKAGFDLFQGYFLYKPQNITSKSIKIDIRRTSQILSELCKIDANVDTVESLICQDPVLSFKLLRIINSAAYVKAKQIESLHQAIVYMGLPKLQAWVSVILLNSTSCRSSEIIKTAMVRAKMAEILIGYKDDNEPTCKFFLSGLFSLIDAIFDEPMETLLEQIKLDQEITDALLERKGPMGELLTAIIYYEQGEWDNLKYDSLTPQQYAQAYQESINWTEAIMSELK